MTDKIDPKIFFDAATSLYDLSEDLSTALGNALSKLSNTGEMAGSDERGKTFSDAYDPLVSDADTIGNDLVSALNHFGSVIRQAGINHAEAESASNLSGGSKDKAPGERSAPVGLCYMLPSSAGGSLDGLLEDIGLNDHLEIPVPDGDTGKLQIARDAWDALHSTISSKISGKLTDVANTFSDLAGEDIDSIIEDLNDLDEGVTEYQNAIAELRDSTESQKEYLDEVRSQLESILRDLEIELGITAVIGIASSFVTFGGGAAIAGTKIAATIVRFAKRISTVIRDVLKLKKLKVSPGMASRLKQAELNQKLISIKRMEVKKAPSLQARSKHQGDLGELKAGLDPAKTKERVQINGRTRIPDDIDDVAKEVIEVKNVNQQSLTEQIRDSIDIAKSRGFDLRIIVDDRTKLSGPLQKLVDNGDVILERMSLN